MIDFHKKSSVIIKGVNLQCNRENRIDIELKPQQFQIIKGTVYDANGNPCVGAIIRVSEKDRKTGTSRVLGYVVTGNEGEYLFSLEAKMSKTYELTVYSPL